jgi:O-antigen/teichoic acid export membrane protein
LQRVITTSTRLIMAVSLPVALILIFWGKEVIGLVFGPQYMGASTALAILCVGQLVNTSVGSVVLVLNMTGHDKQTLIGIAVALILNVSLAIFLVPVWAVDGAAVAFSASMAAWNLILLRSTKKYTGINTFFINFKE